MDTAVDAREGYDPVAARNGRLSLGNTSLTEIANAPADAEWPEGNEVDDGISTQRLSGTPSCVRSGRLRSPISLMSWLTNKELRPIATIPVTAARRPRASAGRCRESGESWLDDDRIADYSDRVCS